MSLVEVRERTEDERLIAAVALGDEGSLATLYDRHASAMLGVAFRVLRSRSDAEDLVHDVFVEAWNKARDFEPSRGSLRSWLLMRVRSRAIDRLRSLDAARRHAMAAAREESIASAFDLQPDWDGSDRERACAALAGLPDEQRALIELAYFEGLTCSEMATHCGIPLGTVKSRLAAGMAKLRQSLLPHGSAV
jgi:RNA polymerase sigma-70 factor (ECF subfamily)